MEDKNSPEVSNLDFFEDRNALKYFAKIDYFLKSGGHIQRDFPQPSGIYRFVESNFLSLQIYYKDFFRVLLSQGGNEFERYYFIDFEGRNKGEISISYRQTLKVEFIVVGMLFFKFYKSDGNFDLDKISDFLSLLFVEYEDEKEALVKFIFNTNQNNSTNRDDESIKKVVVSAFKKFEELGWIYWEDDEQDRFHYLPSFERLRKLYEQQILNIDELVGEAGNV